MNLSSVVTPRLKARAAGVFYAITVVAGMYGYLFASAKPAAHAALLAAGAAYVVVTFLLYELLAPVSRSISMLAVFFSLVGIARTDNATFFFGFYCAVVGYLIFNSTFLPRVLGILMALAGLGLLADTLTGILAPGFSHALSPYALGLDGLGEILLTIWLLAFGVDAVKWEEAAARAPR
jgi:hypothetical protein